MTLTVVHMQNDGIQIQDEIKFSEIKRKKTETIHDSKHSRQTDHHKKDFIEKCQLDQSKLCPMRSL